MKAPRCSDKTCNKFALAYEGQLCKEHYFKKGDDNQIIKEDDGK